MQAVLPPQERGEGSGALRGLPLPATAADPRFPLPGTTFTRGQTLE